VKDAIDAGYRHIDSAFAYGNEAEVGAAVRDKIAEGVVEREDMFIVTKLWNTFHRPDLVEPSLRESLKNFGLDYVDLYLIHMPMAHKEGESMFPADPATGQWFSSDVDYVETYKAMEELVKKGLTKSIGVSNFNKRQIERVLENCSIPPVTNQVELHPYLSQVKLVNFCQSKGITITAFSQFGSPASPFRKPEGS
jgi:aldehyde reductase